MTPIFSKKRSKTFYSDVTTKDDILKASQDLGELKAHVNIRPETKLMEEVVLAKPAPSFIWNSDNKNSEINKSKIALGARKVSDLSVQTLKTSKTKKH